MKEVHRKPNAASGILQFFMIVLAVGFLLMGIMFSRGFMLPCFLMAGLYFVFEYYAAKDYEYILDGRKLSIVLIRGRRSRHVVQELDLDQLVVVAPHDSPAVAAYRKGAAEGKLPKYDYTSYEDDIPYYTMIIGGAEGTKTKLLLDLDEEMLDRLRRLYPGRVRA